MSVTKVKHEDVPTSKNWGISHIKVKKFHYSWTIRNFSYLNKQTSEVLESPSFSIGPNEEANWCLKLYLTGLNDSYKDYLSLYMHRKTGLLGFSGQYTFSVLNDAGKAFLERKEHCEYNSKFASWGFPNFIRSDVLRDESNCLLADDKLTIFCEIAMSVGKDDFSSEDDSRAQRRSAEAKAPASYFEKLFLDDKFSDVELVAACGKSLRAHKIVLVACSPVFEAMFEHDMMEKKVNEVKIDDVDHDVLKEMLRYVYTAEVENVKDLAVELLKVADKYGIVGLKELCEDAMCENVTLENVLLILVVSVQYDVKRSKTRAINFIKAHFKDVTESQYFKILDHVDTLKYMVKEINQ